MMDCAVPGDVNFLLLFDFLMSVFAFIAMYVSFKIFSHRIEEDSQK